MAFYSFQAPQARAGERDVGSESAGAAIRHDLPLLLASNDIDPNQVIVDWVVSDARDAVAQWHAPEHLHGITALRFEDGKWWWRAGSALMPNLEGGRTKLDSPGHDVDNCGVAGPPPTPERFLALGYIDSGLVRTLAGKLPATRRSTALQRCRSQSVILSQSEVSGVVTTRSSNHLSAAEIF